MLNKLLLPSFTNLEVPQPVSSLLIAIIISLISGYILLVLYTFSEVFNNQDFLFGSNGDTLL